MFPVTQSDLFYTPEMKVELSVHQCGKPIVSKRPKNRRQALIESERFGVHSMTLPSCNVSVSKEYRKKIKALLLLGFLRDGQRLTEKTVAKEVMLTAYALGYKLKRLFMSTFKLATHIYPVILRAHECSIIFT